jgi:hypothetical protein
MVQYIGFSRKIAGIKPNKIPSLWKGYASMDGNFMVPATSSSGKGSDLLFICIK